MVWIWAAVVIFVIFTIVMASYVTVSVEFSHRNKDDDIRANMKALFGMVRYKLNIPVLRYRGLNEGVEVQLEQINANADNKTKRQGNITAEVIRNTFDKFMTLLKHTVDLHEWVKCVLGHTHCRQLTWRTTVGVGEAPETAFLVGTVWGLKSSILGYLFRFIKLEAQPRLEVIPAFNRNMLHLEGSFVMRLRVWHMVVCGVQLLLKIRKAEGGFAAWRRVLFPNKEPRLG